MKKFLLIALSVLLFSCAEKGVGGYSVTIKFEGEIPEFKTDTRIVMFNENTIDKISDTTSVIKGIAKFNGFITSPDLCRIRTIGIDPETGQERDIAEFFLENATYTITVPENKEEETTVAGDGEIQHISDSLRLIAREIFNEEGLDSLIDPNASASENSEALRASLSAFNRKTDSVINRYIADNPLSLFSLYHIAQCAEYIPLDSAEKILKIFHDENIDNHVYTMKLKDAISKRQALSEGHRTPDFNINTADGNTLRFSKEYLKNKFTILYFWTAESKGSQDYHLILRKLYSKYRWKGLGIVGISLNSDLDEVNAAIIRDRAWWPHGFDTKGYKSEIAGMYMVHNAPSTYIVDSTGIIVMSMPKESEIDPFLDNKLKVSRSLYRKSDNFGQSLDSQ